MRMIERSTLHMLRTGPLEPASFGTSGQAKDRLIVEALHGPAEPEGETVVILTVEVKFGVEGRGVFQEARVLLIVGAEARVDHIGVRDERQNFQCQRAEAARGDDIVWERRSAGGRHGNRFSIGIKGQGRMRGVGSLIWIINKLRDGAEISAPEVIPRYGQNVKFAA